MDEPHAKSKPGEKRRRCTEASPEGESGAEVARTSMEDGRHQYLFLEH